MEQPVAVIDEVATLLDDVDLALVRLSDGTYRTCEVCGTGLADELLAAAPTRRRCDDHVG